MKKKWLAIVPAVALVTAPLPLQNVSASDDQIVQESELPEELMPVLDIAAEHQPTLKLGSIDSAGNEVAFVQFTLSQVGFETHVDGMYGSHTEEQVQAYQAEHGLASDGIVGVNTWMAFMSEYSSVSFPLETAIHYAEEALDNDDLVFSGDGVLHEDSEGNHYYSLRAQSQSLIDGGGTGTVGFYNVYKNGDVIEAEPES
ncbi:peptidoglycan-binding protein [Alkalihalobacillus sp. NPDC078783]